MGKIRHREISNLPKITQLATADLGFKSKQSDPKPCAFNMPCTFLAGHHPSRRRAAVERETFQQANASFCESLQLVVATAGGPASGRQRFKKVLSPVGRELAPLLRPGRQGDGGGTDVKEALEPGDLLS